MIELGELLEKFCPDNIEYVCLGDLAQYKGCRYYEKTAYEVNDYENYWKVLGVRNISIETNTLNFERLKYINKRVSINPENTLQKGDIVICRRGPINKLVKVAYINDNLNDYIIDSNLAIIRCDSEHIYSRYLFYVLISEFFKNYMNTLACGGALPSLTKSALSNFLVPLIPSEYQHRVVDTLDKLISSLVELNAGKKIEIQENITTTINDVMTSFAPKMDDCKYDVFISYKRKESEWLCQQVYQYLKENGLNPFWSEVSLPEMAKSDYDEAIDSALDSARHFVVVLTNLKQLDSRWITHEMRTFRNEMKEGRKDGANFIFLVTDEVCDEITSSNKKCLPISFRDKEIMTNTQYKEKLLPYVCK